MVGFEGRCCDDEEEEDWDVIKVDFDVVIVGFGRLEEEREGD